FLQEAVRLLAGIAGPGIGPGAAFVVGGAGGLAGVVAAVAALEIKTLVVAAEAVDRGFDCLVAPFDHAGAAHAGDTAIALNPHRPSLATNAKNAFARRSCSIRPSFERHQPVRWMNGPRVKQPVTLKRVFLIDGLHGTAPLTVEFVQHFFRRRAARFEDALQRFEVAALVTAGMVDAVAPPQARMRQLQAFPG